MSLGTEDYEKLGQFYLGKEYDLDSRQVSDDLLLYDSKDLVTHGVVLGMTGSGKTGLCMALLEEAAMDHIPAIVIDPKGDIANLMLTFPDLDAASFKPWVNADDAAKKGLSVDDHSEKTAAMWKKGLADWGQGPERIARLRGQVDVNVFTPGSSAGIPVSILGSLSVPPVEVMEDRELFGDHVSATVESLLSLIGEDKSDAQSHEAVLLAIIFQSEWNAGKEVSLESLISKIQRPNFDKVGVMDLESFYPEKSRQSLALKFNNLLASPGFSTWLEGPPLDIAKMLHRDDGKPRISIFSIAHLSDSERMFFVSLLLNQMVGWMRTQRGTTSLRALLYMDEIFGFLPPTANPPSKRPMMTMLKQARAFGLGCLLATQNPVDLDYKALSNIGTWFLGRLQTERDKLRVLDGLEGAAGSQDAKFDRKQMEQLLSGLGNRVFLMNNVHEDQPVLFHVRWVMSYLTGPLTRNQIKILMDGKRGEFLVAEAKPSAPTGINPMLRAGADVLSSVRPVVGNGVIERFAPTDGDLYEPFLLREATVHFNLTKGGIEGSRKVVKMNRLLEDGIDWDETIEMDAESFSDQPGQGMSFGKLPGYAMNASNYKPVAKQFEDELYRNERVEVWCCPELKTWGEVGESEGDFRIRISQKAREARDQAMEKLKDSLGKKIDMLEGRRRTAESQLAREQAEANSAKLNAGVSVLGGILKAVFGRKVGIGGTTSGSITKTTSAYKQHRDVATAESKIEAIQQDMEVIGRELEEGLAEIERNYDAATINLEKENLKPRRTDVVVERVGLVWR